ncbi:unnamed protein product [Vitrella brassicaformis CCMP3155]|uniref:Uncharacterized protein n=1 Tax=Vitrella brassicaformis (strain CCMP3155) TaxID=1169540 RepID=A0A0G4FWC7_VITBC|nr:unnamed protein product [Vitrella brassicaformis CCMP3155]|eukprot:CEM19509.1 unnamed protein product [Vitrella brassicaformis CCMP3155]
MENPQSPHYSQTSWGVDSSFSPQHVESLRSPRYSPRRTIASVVPEESVPLAGLADGETSQGVTKPVASTPSESRPDSDVVRVHDAEMGEVGSEMAGPPEPHPAQQPVDVAGESDIEETSRPASAGPPSPDAGTIDDERRLWTKVQEYLANTDDEGRLQPDMVAVEEVLEAGGEPGGIDGKTLLHLICDEQSWTEKGEEWLKWLGKQERH